MASPSQKHEVASGVGRTWRLGTFAGAAMLLLAAGTQTYVPLRAAGSPTPPSAALQTAARAVPTLLDRSCVGCHNDRLRTAGLSLQALDPADTRAHADTWEKVAKKLRTREMPPPGRPAPDEGTYAAFASALERDLDAAAAAHPNPGPCSDSPAESCRSTPMRFAI